MRGARPEGRGCTKTERGVTARRQGTSPRQRRESRWPRQVATKGGPTANLSDNCNAACQRPVSTLRGAGAGRAGGGDRLLTPQCILGAG